MRKESIEYTKDLAKFIRAEIKKQVAKKKLPDITYQVTRIQKTNLQKIRINFDGRALNYEEKVRETEVTLNKLFSKYQTFSCSERGAIDIYVRDHLKGKTFENEQHRMLVNRLNSLNDNSNPHKNSLL